MVEVAEAQSPPDSSIVESLNKLRDETTAELGIRELVDIGGAAAPFLIEALRSADPTLRMNAAYTLGLMPGTEATVAALIEAMADDSRQVHFAAVRALTNLVPLTEGSLSALIKTLNNDNTSVRRGAAYVLGTLGPKAEAAVPNLIKGLKDPDMRVRLNAAESMVKIGLEVHTVVSTLAMALTDESRQIRQRAAFLIGKIGPEAKAAIPALKIALLDEDKYVRWTAAEALVLVGFDPGAAVTVLIQSLQDEDRRNKMRAANILGNIGPEAREAIPVLREMLHDPDGQVRWAAAQALLRIDPDVNSTIPLHIEALQDKNANNRISAAAALGDIGPPAKVAIPALAAVLDDENAQVRSRAAWALGRIGPEAKDAVPALIKTLIDNSEKVRFEAAWALGNIGAEAKEAVLALMTILEDESPRVRYEAAWALGRIGPEAKQAVPALIKTLKDENEKVRYESAWALGRMGSEAKNAVGDLILALADENDRVRTEAAWSLGRIGPEAKQAVPALVTALKDGHARVRMEVAVALGNIGPQAKSTAAALKNALQDDDKQVRQNAAAALVKIGEDLEAAVAVHMEALDDEKLENRLNAIAALGDIGPTAKTALPILSEALQDDNMQIRIATALAVAKIGYDTTLLVPVLIEALQSEDEQIQNAAALVLWYITGIVQDKADSLAVADLEKTIADLEKGLSVLENSESRSITRGELVKFLSRSLNNLTTIVEIKKKSVVRELLAWMLNNKLLSVSAIYLITALLFWLTLLRFRPLWVLHINDAVDHYKTKFPKPWGVLGIFLHGLLLGSFFQYHLRVLDAWIGANVALFREELLKKETIRERSIHIPIPVVIDGHTIAEIDGKKLRKTFSKKRACLLIWGEGGSGKTSLACQIANWAISDDAGERICDHVMLPVLVEQELDLMGKENEDSFTEAIQGQLQAMIGLAAPISENFLEKLLRHRRILVIVDHLSEMSEATRHSIRPGAANFSTNALIVTSRINETLDNVPRTAIVPLRIEGNRLSSFMEAYLTHREKRHLFNDPEYFDACRQLSMMVGDRKITVLLAKLFAEQMISTKEGSSQEKLPDSIPGLMFRYLNELNRGASKDDPDDRTVHRDAKVIAWECIQQTYKPTVARRDEVIAALGGDNAEERLDYLENKLRVIQTLTPAKDQIRFMLDTIAEYFAAFHLLELNNGSASAWREFFGNADSIPGSPDSIGSFLLAVLECSRSKMCEADLPDFVATEFHNRVQLLT